MAKPSSTTATPQRTSTDATSSRTSSRPEWIRRRLGPGEQAPQPTRTARGLGLAAVVAAAKPGHADVELAVDRPQRVGRVGEQVRVSEPVADSAAARQP